MYSFSPPQNGSRSTDGFYSCNPVADKLSLGSVNEYVLQPQKSPSPVSEAPKELVCVESVFHVTYCYPNPAAEEQETSSDQLSETGIPV